MSRELDLLAKEYQSKKATVLRKELNLYRTTMSTASASFLREVEQECKKMKQSKITLVATLEEVPNEKR